MRGLSELVVDALGLVCSLFSWFIIVISPIEFFTLALLSGDSLYLPAWMSLAAILGGIFLKWLANGILMRRRVRMSVAACLCLLAASLMIWTSVSMGASNVYTAVEGVLIAGVLLIATSFLSVVAFGKRAEA